VIERRTKMSKTRITKHDVDDFIFSIQEFLEDVCSSEDNPTFALDYFTKGVTFEVENFLEIAEDYIPRKRQKPLLKLAVEELVRLGYLIEGRFHTDKDGVDLFTVKGHEGRSLKSCRMEYEETWAW
jgi:hypothetical protein